MPQVLHIDAPRLDGRDQLLDLIGEAMAGGADWVAVPASALPDAFFELRTGLAGDVTQKFVQYGVGLAIVGDVSARTAASRSLRDFVTECNRGRRIWFVADQPALDARLHAT